MKKSQLVRLALWGLGGALAAWIGIRFLLPLLLPFLIGLFAAKLAQPPVRFLKERAGLPGWLAAGLVVMGAWTLLGFGLYWLCRAACGELVRFTQELPSLLESLAGPVERLRAWLERSVERAPELLQETVRESVDGLFSNGQVVAERATGWLFSLARWAVAKVPDLVLFWVTALLSSVMLANQYESLLALARRELPKSWVQKCGAAVGGVKRTLSAWLQAELKLLGVTFLLVTFGSMLLGVEFPLLIGALVAAIDALPVFGAGTVLLPWSAVCFLRGDSRMGVGLLLLYAAAYLTRTMLEPRLLGKQVGLDPLATLLALYAGYRVWGVLGMLVFPIGAVLAKQLWRHIARGWGQEA